MRVLVISWEYSNDDNSNDDYINHTIRIATEKELEMLGPDFSIMDRINHQIFVDIEKGYRFPINHNILSNHLGRFIIYNDLIESFLSEERELKLNKLII